MSDQYQRKHETAQAWQFTEANKMTSPQWVTGLFLSGRIYFQGGETPCITIAAENVVGNRPERLYRGDWLMMADGWVWGETEEAFKAKWEPVVQAAEREPDQVAGREFHE